ncbi:hypothetical protein JXM83_03785 [Candidatus Woesearchaeota archaeon]|nr:hypothetical protein [Candidatus Woesearchaeota archaeon]
MISTVTMVDSNALKKSLVGFMSEHFGDVIGKQLLSMKLLQYKKFDLDEFSDYELKSFIDVLIDSLFGKIRTDSQVKMIKLDLLNKIFGKEESINVMAQEQDSAKVKPIEFLQVLFGTDLGKSVLKTAKMEFNEPHIETGDELQQIMFLKRVVEKLFNYDENLKDDVDVMMLSFVKNGKVTHNVLEEDVDKRTLHMFEDLLFWIREFNSGDVDLAIKGIHNLNMDDTLRKDLDDLEIKVLGKVQNDDEQSRASSIEVFIADYLGLDGAHEFMEQEKAKFDVKEILALPEEQQHEFIDDFMHQGVLNEYSLQRKKYMVGKMLSFFGMI